MQKQKTVGTEDNEEKVKQAQIEKKVDEDRLYLVDPSQKEPPMLSDEILDKITEKAISRSKRLAK